MKSNKGFVNVLLILVGFVIVAVLFGFFTTHRTYSPVTFPDLSGASVRPYESQYTNTSCGLVVTSYTDKQKISSPFTLGGYSTGCGWIVHANSLGTVQVLNGNGQVISATYSLAVAHEDLFSPAYFLATIHFSSPHTSDGTLLIKSTDQNNPKVLVLPVVFNK